MKKIGIISLFFAAAFYFNACRKTISINISQVLVDTLTHKNLQDIEFINKDTGFIVGGLRWGAGEVLYTYDGGATWKLKDTFKQSYFIDNTWQLKDSATHWAINGIAALPNRKLIAVGGTGKIFYSNDRAKTWTVFQTPEWKDLQRIVYVSDSVTIAIGSTAYSSGLLQRLSTNQNATWQAQNFNRQLNAITFVNATTGFIAAFGAVYKTTDAGRSWQITAAKGDNFSGIYFFNSQHGLVIGSEGSLLETVDGGESWKTKRNGNSPFNATWQFTAIAFVNENVGYISGRDGLLLQTTDGGNHWRKTNYFSSQTIRQIYVQSAQRVWLVGDDATVFILQP